MSRCKSTCESKFPILTYSKWFMYLMCNHTYVSAFRHHSKVSTNWRFWTHTCVLTCTPSFFGAEGIKMIKPCKKRSTMTSSRVLWITIVVVYNFLKAIIFRLRAPHQIFFSYQDAHLENADLAWFYWKTLNHSTCGNLVHLVDWYDHFIMNV